MEYIVLFVGLLGEDASISCEDGTFFDAFYFAAAAVDISMERCTRYVGSFGFGLGGHVFHM